MKWFSRGEGVRAHAGFPQFFSAGSTSDHPCIESTLYTLNTWVVWSATQRNLSLSYQLLSVLTAMLFTLEQNKSNVVDAEKNPCCWCCNKTKAMMLMSKQKEHVVDAQDWILTLKFCSETISGEAGMRNGNSSVTSVRGVTVTTGVTRVAGGRGLQVQQGWWGWQECNRV